LPAARAALDHAGNPMKSGLTRARDAMQGGGGEKATGPRGRHRTGSHVEIIFSALEFSSASAHFIGTCAGFFPVGGQMSRPVFRPTSEQRTKVMRYVYAGMVRADIAVAIGVDQKTLNKQFRTRAPPRPRDHAATPICDGPRVRAGGQKGRDAAAGSDERRRCVLTKAPGGVKTPAARMS
jgi:hypothetical protein